MSDPSRYAPHRGVYARLQPSTLQGIGVYAIRSIPEGTKVFATDEPDMSEIDPALTRGLDPAIRALYDDFCVREDGRLYGPKSFNQLTVAWYLNNSDDPNIICDDAFNFVAKRDIEVGQELTVEYVTYSKGPPISA